MLGTETEQAAAAEAPPEKLVQVPLSKIKAIMKSDPEVGLVSKDAVLLTAKATELFLHHLAEKSYGQTQLTKRKGVQMQDVANSVMDELEFLDGIFEQKDKAMSF